MKQLVLGTLFFAWACNSVSFAEPKSVRWTGKEDKDSNLVHVLEVLKSKTGVELSAANFMLVESRNLATSHYLMLAQTSGGIPVSGLSLRIWTTLDKNEVIQVEARVDATPASLGWSAKSARAAMSSQETMELVRAALKKSEDPSIRKVQWRDMWENGQVVRVVNVNAKRGKHSLTIGLS
ncbi:MAG: hypothetical protein ACKOA8_09395, partial [Deltaproteobacteria bacterium]